jgi:hypothetical protein
MTDSNGREGAGVAGAARVVRIGDRDVTIERPNGRKASLALGLIKALTRAAPQLQAEYAAFVRDYERNNVIELDRAQARVAYPPRPFVDGDGRAVIEPATLRDPDSGEEKPNPRAGEVVLLPSPIDRMTEEDWQQSGHLLRRPASPRAEEAIVAILDHALEVAEEHVYRLLALFTIPNADVRAWRQDGTLDAKLGETVDRILDDGFGDELIDLALAAADTVDHHFVRKAQAAGESLGKLRSLFGMRSSSRPAPPVTTSTDGPSSTTPPSSTDSPAPTPDGPPTPSSSSRSSSSSPSPTSSTVTP